MMVKGYKQENGLVSIQLPRGDYLVEGVAVKVESYQGETVIATEDVSIKCVHTNRIPVEYVNRNTQEKITATEFQQMCVTLRNSGLDVDGDWIDEYKRLELEMAQFVWQPTYATTTDLEDVSVDVIGEAPHDHPYIIAIRKINGDLTNTLYRYKRHLHIVDTIVAELTKCGWNQIATNAVPTFGAPKVDVNSFAVDPTRPRWTKLFTVASDRVTETYLSSACPTIEHMLTETRTEDTPTGKWEDMLTQFNNIDTMIRIAIRGYVNRTRSVNETSLTIGEVVSAVRKIQTLHRSVDTKVATATQYEQCRDEIAKLLDVVSRAAAEEVNDR